MVIPYSAFSDGNANLLTKHFESTALSDSHVALMGNLRSMATCLSESLEEYADALFLALDNEIVWPYTPGG